MSCSSGAHIGWCDVSLHNECLQAQVDQTGVCWFRVRGQGGFCTKCSPMCPLVQSITQPMPCLQLSKDGLMFTRNNGEQICTFPIDSILAVAQPARTQLDLQVNVMLRLNFLAGSLPGTHMQPCLYPAGAAARRTQWQGQASSCRGWAQI